MSCALTEPFDWNAPSKEPNPGNVVPAIAVRAVFRGVVTHARVLSFPTSPRAKACLPFTIGSQAGVDAPVASEFIPWPSHPLVLAAGSGFVINVTPQMQGRVRVGDKFQSLATFTRDNGRTFTLPPFGSAQLDCGATSFVVSRTTPPRALPAPTWKWTWNRHGYMFGSAALLVALVLLFAFIPADPRALSLDLLGSDNRLVRSLITPPLLPEDATPPARLTPKTGSAVGLPARRTSGVEGSMGDRNAARREARFALRGDNTNRDPVLAKTRAADVVRTAGILGVLKSPQGSLIASIFGADNALGPDGQDVLGHLVGSQIATASGSGGLGSVGTGESGVGPGDKLIGTGRLNTIGDRVHGDPDGTGRQPGVGTLGPRHLKTLNWVPSPPQVRGGLDKEIVRRVVRLHLNEIKYCYEQELARTPSLNGRVVVQFTIVPSGQVIASTLQTSTVANARVESCTVQAIRRWQFPKPDGGGLVTVTYPFVLTPAGG